MIIRPAMPSEVGPLAALARATYTDAFDHSFSASDLAAHLETRLSDAYFRAIAEDVFLFAEDEGRLIGFIQFGDAGSMNRGDQEIRRLYVLSAFQNRRAGTKLTIEALAHPRLRDAQNVWLDVWERNDGARRLYERFGFSIAGSKPLTLASGVAADRDLIMVRRAPARGGR